MAKFSWHKVKRAFLDVIERKQTPHKISLGFGYGIFIGMFPLPYINLAIGFILAVPLHIDWLGFVLGLTMINMFILPLIYFADYKIGVWLLGHSGGFNLDTLNWASIVPILKPLLIGGLIFSTVCGVLSYGLMWLVLHLLAERHERKKGKKRGSSTLLFSW